MTHILWVTCMTFRIRPSVHSQQFEYLHTELIFPIFLRNLNWQDRQYLCDPHSSYAQHSTVPVLLAFK